MAFKSIHVLSSDSSCTVSDFGAYQVVHFLHLRAVNHSSELLLAAPLVMINPLDYLRHAILDEHTNFQIVTTQKGPKLEISG